MELPARPVILRRGEGETIFDDAERTIRVLADCDEMTLSWFRYGAGVDGPEAHVHRRHADAFYVLEGKVELGLGPGVERFTATPGSLAAAPPNVVHTFRNASAAPATFLNVHAPSSGFADMLRARRDGRSDDAARFDQFQPPDDGGRRLSDAVFRGPGEGEPSDGRTLSKAAGRETDGCFGLTETVLKLGKPLVQRAVDFVRGVYVLEGTVSMTLADGAVELVPGDFALAPPGATYALENRSGESARALTLVAPSPS